MIEEAQAGPGAMTDAKAAQNTLSVMRRVLPGIGRSARIRSDRVQAGIAAL
jgi:hypothetical protein